MVVLLHRLKNDSLAHRARAGTNHEAREVVMAGAAHLGVALAAKRAAPRMPLWALVLGS